MKNADFADRHLRGRRAKLTGALFERLIDASCRYYEDAGVARIEKTPEPMKPISGMDRRGQFQACFTKAAQPDYKGSLRGGRAVVFEAKYTDGDTIAQNRLTQAQFDAMEAYHAMGALCFLLLSFGFADFYRVPWEHWRVMREIYGRKHLKREDLEKFRVWERGNVLYFLDEIGGQIERGTKPTKRQAIILQAHRLNHRNWLVCKDTPKEMVIRHRESGKERILKK